MQQGGDGIFLAPLFEFQRQFSPPVRKIVGRAGDHELVGLPEGILQPQQHDVGRGSGQQKINRAHHVGHHIGHGNRMDIDVGRQQVFLFQRDEQASAGDCPGHDGVVAGIFGGKELQCRAFVQIAPEPESSEGWLVDPGRDDGRFRRIFPCRQEFFGLPVGEQRFARQHARVFQPFHDVRRNGFAVGRQHQTAIALAFQGKDPQEVLEGKGDIAAVLGAPAGRNPVLPGQVGHLVHQHGADMPHRLPQTGGERAVGRFSQTRWCKGRNGGDAAVRAGFGRRRTEPDAGRMVGLLRPDFRTARGGTEYEFQA